MVAIIKTVCKLKLVTDQRSMAFICASKKCSKIKDAKIQEWKLRLAAFIYKMKYHAGK